MKPATKGPERKGIVGKAERQAPERTDPFFGADRQSFVFLLLKDRASATLDLLLSPKYRFDIVLGCDLQRVPMRCDQRRDLLGLLPLHGPVGWVERLRDPRWSAIVVGSREELDPTYESCASTSLERDLI